MKDDLKDASVFHDRLMSTQICIGGVISGINKLRLNNEKREQMIVLSTRKSRSLFFLPRFDLYVVCQRVTLSVGLSFSMLACHSDCQPGTQSVSQSVSPSLSLSAYYSVCQPVYQSVRLLVCQPFTQSMSLSLSLLVCQPDTSLSAC